ncbi:hypothetical protein BsWGS_00946 [Bradybaena similaris]
MSAHGQQKTNYLRWLSCRQQCLHKSLLCSFLHRCTAHEEHDSDKQNPTRQQQTEPDTTATNRTRYASDKQNAIRQRQTKRDTTATNRTRQDTFSLLAERSHDCQLGTI